MRRFLVPFAGLAAGLVVVLVVTLAGNQPARVGAPSTDQQSGLAAAQTTQSSSGGPNEGIRVHGNWTIEVRNADGTLASRTDFENALVGGPVLSMVLARLTSVGYWSILLEAPANASTGPCGTTPLPPPYNLNPCYLVEAGSTGAVPGTTLTVTAPTSGADAGKLVLSGTGTASANSSIASVSTKVNTCVPASPPSTTCNQVVLGTTPITSTTLATPIAVSAGQQLQVTVRISFQ